MRELTTLENETFRTEYRKFMDYQSTINDVELNRFKFGYIAGLETQDSRIAELEFLLRLDCVAPAIEGYKVGRQAALDNQYLTDCPYDAHAIERKAWMEGYNQVRFEQSKVR